MEKVDFVKLESMCQSNYSEAGNCYHICSQENLPVIFHNEEEFKAAMNVIAYVAFLFPEIRIYTFEIMDNHFHFTLSGNREKIDSFLKTLVAKLLSHPSLKESYNDIKKIAFKIIMIESLENLRNVISYNNRNGAVVLPDENVFTYRWGANRFFFNREAKLRYEECGRKATFREKRKLFNSRLLDGVENVILLDGYVSPLCYCRIEEAESFFRNSRHYFHSVSRNIESAKDIAKSIGENIFYSDDDLFSYIRTLCSKNYGCQSVTCLSSGAKIDIAKKLHYDFNANNKQICRLLKMELNIVESLFPKGF